ncbi:MAG: phosphatidate cytidylyltransferase [Bdellovibrionota bacterium]
MKTRAISALVAVALLSAIFYQWRIMGLYGICGVAILISTFEFSRLTFKKFEAPNHLRWAFIVFSLFLCFITLMYTEHAIKAASVFSILFLSMVLFTVRANTDLTKVLQFQTYGLMGFFYCGIFPALVLKPLSFENGAVWFFGLLAIVFSGDTFAYLVGRFFGKTKLLEPVSPKKTVEGAIGGLFGSAIAGAVLNIYFLDGAFPLWQFMLVALVTGGFAQIGDLFESLLKRIAEVKDSGSIMPGHGGVLDRLDGVLFAAPVYYWLALALLGSS